MTNQVGRPGIHATGKLTIAATPAPIQVASGQSFAFQSGPSAPTLTTASTGYTLASDAGAAQGQVTWSLASGTLPAGITLDAATGKFVGKATGTANATSTVSVKATDSYGTASQPTSVTLTLIAPPGISAATVTAYRTQQPNVSLASAMGGSNLVGATWSVAGGSALPSGMNLAADGTLTGSPDNVATSTLTVTVTNAGASPALSSSAILTLRAVPAPPTLPQTASFTFQSGPSAPTLTTSTAGYSVPVTATGSVTWRLVPNNLPAGITLDSATGKFVGKATGTVNGVLQASIVATDSYGSDSNASSLSLYTVAPPVLSAGTVTGTTGVQVNQSLASLMNAGNLDGATWAVTGATPLPTGLNLSTGGTLTGSLSEANNQAVTVSVTNAGRTPALTSSATLTLNIAGPAPVVQSGQSFSFAKGTNVAVGAAGYTVATNISGAKTFEVQSGTGTLPTGISFDTSTGAFTGTWNGTANASTTYGVRGRSTASGQVSGYASLTLKTFAPPILQSGKTVNGNKSQSMSVSLATLLTTGTAADNLVNTVWTATGLPTGLTLSTAGILSGTVDTTGSTTATVTATNNDSNYSQSASVPVTVTIATPSTQAKDNYPTTITVHDSNMNQVSSTPVATCYGQNSKSPGVTVPMYGYVVHTFSFPVTVTSMDFQSGGQYGWAGGYLPTLRFYTEWWNDTTKVWVSNQQANASSLTSSKFRVKNESPHYPQMSFGVCRYGNGTYPPSLN